MHLVRLPLFSILSLGLAASAQAQSTINWNGNGSDNKWSNAANWSEDQVPNGNAHIAQFNLAVSSEIDVDGNYTVNRYVDGAPGGGQTHSLTGSGTLTLDVNNNTMATSIGIENSTTGQGGTLRIGNRRVVIKNSQGTVTTIRNLNSSGNVIIFDKDSTLTLNTILRVIPGSGGGRIEFNGTLARSEANLQIGSPNAIFGEGHDSTAFGREIVLLPNSRLTVNGGSVLGSGRRFQVNGKAHLVLNGTNAINGANILVNDNNELTLDVNANQGNMGTITNIGKNLTINLDSSVKNLSFPNCSRANRNWMNGTLTIGGFRENTIRFGTNANGLTKAQLERIDGGKYSLSREGYLTAN